LYTGLLRPAPDRATGGMSAEADTRHEVPGEGDPNRSEQWLPSYAVALRTSWALHPLSSWQWGLTCQEHLLLFAKWMQPQLTARPVRQTFQPAWMAREDHPARKPSQSRPWTDSGWRDIRPW